METLVHAKTWHPWVFRTGIAVTLLAALSGVVLAEAALRRSAEAPLPPLPQRFEAALRERARAMTPARPLAEVSLRRGETFSDALVSLGLDNAGAMQVAAAAVRFVDPRSLQPGDRFLSFGTASAVPAAIHVALSGRGELRLERGPDGWKPTWRASERRVQLRSLNAVLTGSLDGSIRAAGGNPMLANRMSDVLQWDLDFNRDLQPGDRFSVLYEEVSLDGIPSGPGHVLAMRYQSGNRTLEAYRFGEDDYYDASGRPLKKMFLKSPLPYSRVTSQFSTQRFHPILKKVVPHWGIDLGAPVGTPVRATASGVVLSAGWEGGGGKAIKIRHANGYITGYLHLSAYASDVRTGARVSQGQVIGYVGQTGLATGPHLDYRVQLNGTWVNPMGLKGVDAPVIAQKDLDGFQTWRDALRASLDRATPVPTAPYLLARVLPGADGAQTVQPVQPALSTARR